MDMTPFTCLCLNAGILIISYWVYFLVHVFFCVLKIVHLFQPCIIYKKGLSAIRKKYAVSKGIVLHVVYYSEFLPEYANKSEGSAKYRITDSAFNDGN